MDSSYWPLILIEGVLVFGGALAFGWWQLRSVKRDREKAQAEREQARLREKACEGGQAPDSADSAPANDTGPRS